MDRQLEEGPGLTIASAIVASFERFLGRQRTWSAEPLAHNRWLTPEVWRVRTESTSYVFKRLSAGRDPATTAWEAHWSAGADQPQHWNYWSREALAYQHGVTDMWASEGIVAPDPLLVDGGANFIDLWLEDIDGLPGDRWALGDYAAAARALGAGQARVARYRDPAPLPFLSRNFLRDYSIEKPVAWELLDSDAAWTHPLVRGNVPKELRAAALRLHANRERLYAIARSVPRTICHLDFWPKNLFRRGDQIVLIDWAFVGDGALGEDVGNLVPDSVLDGFVPAAQLPDLEAAVFTAYLGGVRSAGWAGDARLVQLGMWASSIKYDWLTPAMLASASAEHHLAYGGHSEVDAGHRFRERGATLLHLTRWADQALTLAGELGLSQPHQDRAR